MVRNVFVRENRSHRRSGLVATVAIPHLAINLTKTKLLPHRLGSGVDLVVDRQCSGEVFLLAQLVVFLGLIRDELEVLHHLLRATFLHRRFPGGGISLDLVGVLLHHRILDRLLTALLIVEAERACGSRNAAAEQ